MEDAGTAHLLLSIEATIGAGLLRARTDEQLETELAALLRARLEEVIADGTLLGEVRAAQRAACAGRDGPAGREA